MSIKESRETIALDFDGVLHDYSEWNGVVPTGPPVKGALEFVTWLKARGFSLYVLSARADKEGGPEAIRDWLKKWGFPKMKATCKKRGGCLLIDDRGLRFEGDFEEMKDWIRANPEPGRWGLDRDSKK